MGILVNTWNRVFPGYKIYYDPCTYVIVSKNSLLHSILWLSLAVLGLSAAWYFARHALGGPGAKRQTYAQRLLREGERRGGHHGHGHGHGHGHRHGSGDFGQAHQQQTEAGPAAPAAIQQPETAAPLSLETAEPRQQAYRGPRGGGAGGHQGHHGHHGRVDNGGYRA